MSQSSEQYPVLFEQKEVRRVWYNSQWWFSVADVVEILSESTDVKQYIKKMRSRVLVLMPTGVQFVPPLKWWLRMAKKDRL